MKEFFSPLLRTGVDTVHQNVIHPVLTSGEARADREIAHERAMKLMEAAQGNELIVKLLSRTFTYNDPILETSFAGIKVPNPLGVAAGFDKNAKVHDVLGRGLGFGSVTVGSITHVAYSGNERPRVFDLPHSRSLINRMGFPGEGSREAVKRLESDNPYKRRYALIVNFAASKPSFETGNHIEHYNEVAKSLVRFGDEGEINVSSPNTPGVRSLQEPEVFEDIADATIPVYRNIAKPIRVKFGDLEREKLEKNARTIIDKGGSGIVLGNTTVDQSIREKLSKRDNNRHETGGISGRALRKKALEVSHQMYKFIGEEIPIHRAGGVATARDAWDALTYGGATTVDVYTAFVQRESSTPNFSYAILKDLAKAMREYGMDSMADFKSLRGLKVPYPLR